MEITIEDALPEDELQVITLWKACNLVASYNDPGADFRFALDGATSCVLVAKDTAARIVGSVMVGHDGHRGWLYYLAATPDARGRGIGKAMVEAGEQWLQRRGVPKVQLMIRPANTAVASFYEHLGYEDMPRVLMSKWLTQPG